MSSIPTIRLAARDWDFLTPLILGDLKSERMDLKIDRVSEPNLPHVGESDTYGAAEASFSRYAQRRAAGDKTIVGIPNFILRGFRHRCVITRSDSPLESLAQLKGMKIGLTGWQDSGNTWTRAAARREGLEIEDATWFIGRLSEHNPVVDRLGSFARPGSIESAPGQRPLMTLLGEGWLDAVFTPFMPVGFFEPEPRFRQVDRNFRLSEKAYFKDVGYVPGIHLVTVKSSLVAQYPWLPQELSDLIDASRRMWRAKRERHADATPWLVEELIRSSQDLPQTWDESGLASNSKMINDFTNELYEQGITSYRLQQSDLFIDEATNVTAGAAVSVA
jgi:4,5-dihydroxyphthalate decarboxylase